MWKCLFLQIQRHLSWPPKNTEWAIGGLAGNMAADRAPGEHFPKIGDCFWWFVEDKRNSPAESLEIFLGGKKEHELTQINIKKHEPRKVGQGNVAGGTLLTSLTKLDYLITVHSQCTESDFSSSTSILCLFLLPNHKFSTTNPTIQLYIGYRKGAPAGFLSRWDSFLATHQLHQIKSIQYSSYSWFGAFWPASPSSLQVDMSLVISILSVGSVHVMLLIRAG